MLLNWTEVIRDEKEGRGGTKPLPSSVRGVGSVYLFVKCSGLVGSRYAGMTRAPDEEG